MSCTCPSPFFIRIFHPETTHTLKGGTYFALSTGSRWGLCLAVVCQASTHSPLHQPRGISRSTNIAPHEAPVATFARDYKNAPLFHTCIIRP